MTNGVEQANCCTKHNIGRLTVAELLNKRNPSMLNCKFKKKF